MKVSVKRDMQPVSRLMEKISLKYGIQKNLSVLGPHE